MIIFILLLGSFGIFAHHLYILWPYTVDDAFISFRYAYNFAHHGKILWNVGHAPIEGYTSFLDVLGLSLGFLTHIPIIIWSKLIGILSVLGVGVICLRSSLTAKNTAFSLTLALLYVFFITDMITAIHVVAGLETALYFFLLFSTLILFSSINNRALPHNLFVGQIKLFSIICLLVGLTRPEANLYNLIFLISACISLQKERLRYFIKAALLLYILPGLIYFIWRLHYYHTFFPLPFYIKFAHHGRYPGLQETTSFLLYYWPLLLMMVILWIQVFKKQKLIIITYAMVFVSGLLFSYHALPLMDYSFRFSWPMISLVLASGWFIRDLSENRQKISIALLMLAIALFTYKNCSEALKQEKASTAYAIGMEKAHISLGKALGTIQSNDFLATCDSGAIPFYSHWPVIDNCALNNKTLATTQLSPSQQAEYILTQHPRVIILISTSRKIMEPLFPFERALYDEATKTKMRLLKRYQFQSNYYLWVMGYPDDKAVTSALNETSKAKQ